MLWLASSRSIFDVGGLQSITGSEITGVTPVKQSISLATGLVAHYKWKKKLRKATRKLQLTHSLRNSNEIYERKILTWRINVTVRFTSAMR